MKCPVCGSSSSQVLKSKGKTSKELLLKCEECGTIFRETVNVKKPINCRVVISEFEKSHKKFIKVYPDETLLWVWFGALSFIGARKTAGLMTILPVSHSICLIALSVRSKCRAGKTVTWLPRIIRCLGGLLNFEAIYNRSHLLMLLCNIKTLHTCLYQDNSSKSRVK